MEVVVKDIKGKETGKLKLNKGIFGVEPNEHAIYLDVKQYLANNRQGTHKAKHRGELSGSTRKLHKQKGTGGSRKGSIKNPLFRGGGRVFGPEPRDYSFKLNKKLKQLARKSALSMKATEKSIVVLKDFDFEAPKTKDFIAILEALGLKDKKTLLVLGDSNKNVYLSSRNLNGAEVVTTSELNTYGIMNANNLVLTESSVGKIETILS